ncbi:MAG: hypothetical protein AB7R89_04290 [Dehalococcoidia bacterium]
MSDEIDHDLYHRLCDDRSPEAQSEFCEQYIPLLNADRRWIVPGVRDEHMITDAVLRAVLTFVEHPERYDPTKLKIMDYLRMSAKGDLRNLMARERKHSSRRAPLDAVDLQRSVGNEPQEPASLPAGVSQDLLLRRLRERFPDPRDQRAVRLILDGAKKNEEFARIYNLGDLPLAEQRVIVKRHKDRLKKAMKRMGIRFRDGG